MRPVVAVVLRGLPHLFEMRLNSLAELLDHVRRELGEVRGGYLCPIGPIFDVGGE